MSKPIKITYLRKILISYFIIFIIPFLIFSYVFQFKYKQILEDQLIKNSQKKLSTLQSNVENEIDQIEKIVNQMILTKNLVPSNYDNDSITAIKRMDSLKQYTRTNSFIEEMLIYYNNGDFIYSSESSHMLLTNFNHVYNFLEWPVENMINDLKNRERKFIKPNTPLKIYTKALIDKYTILGYPLTNKGFTYYGTLLFLINENSFRNIMSTIYDANNNFTVILDTDNNIIASKGSSQFVNHIDLPEIVNNSDSKIASNTLELNGNEYLVTSSKWNDYNWTFINIVSVNAALKIAADTQKMFFFVSILLFVLGIFIIYLLLTYNYKPIKKLFNLSNQLLTEDSSNDYNEIGSIEHALHYLSDKNAALNEVIDDTKIASKAYIIGQILSGQSLKSELMDRDTIKKIMNPCKNIYFSFIINISQEENLWSDMKFDLLTNIEDYSNEHIEFMCKESAISNSITVLALGEKEYENHIDEILNKILNDIHNKWKAEVTIGVGNFFNSLDELPKSFVGASSAIDYRLMVGTGYIIYYKDIVDNMKKITTFPYSDLELFKLSIKKGNVKDVDTILNNLVEQFASNTIPIFVARGICYEIISCVVSNYEELGMDYQESFKKYPDIFSITKYESISKIIELIKLISYDICKALSNTYDTDNKILISNMNDYIKDNYTDSNFSLQSMAEHYNTLPPNLSSFYKENTNENIFEVVTNLRMNTAKELLVNSKLPVNQICSKIGYDNVSSFIRRFKQYSGITPGQYRNINK